jgi:hypothetical protein
VNAVVIIAGEKSKFFFLQYFDLCILLIDSHICIVVKVGASGVTHIA